MYHITFHVTVLGGTEYTDGAMVGHITLRAVYLPLKRKTVRSGPILQEQNIRSRNDLQAFLSLLIIWEIWCERNAIIFRKQEMSAPGLFSKIKNETAAWAIAGAKHLSY